MITTDSPFVLRFSKDERRVFRIEIGNNLKDSICNCEIRNGLAKEHVSTESAPRLDPACGVRPRLALASTLTTLSA